MRTLFEIIDSAKNGKMPTHEECYWAMLALSALHFFDHNDLIKLARREEMEGKRPVGVVWFAQESVRRFQIALNKSPKDYVGPNDDPSNPDVQARRKIGLKMLEKLEKNFGRDPECLCPADGHSELCPVHKVNSSPR